MLEGVFTFCVGIVAIFTLQDTPARTKGWLDDRDKEFLRLRTKFMYGGGGMGAKDEFRWPDVVQAVKVGQPIVIWLTAVRSHLGCVPDRHLQHDGAVRLLAVSADDR